MQRVQLARVLLQLENGEPPGYLLLDEPTASLDLAHQLMVIRLMRTLAGEGLGVLAILHDLNLAAMAADRIVALRHGRVAAEGTPAEIMTDEAIERIYGVRIAGQLDARHAIPAAAGWGDAAAPECGFGRLAAPLPTIRGSCPCRSLQTLRRIPARQHPPGHGAAPRRGRRQRRARSVLELRHRAASSF